MVILAGLLCACNRYSIDDEGSPFVDTSTPAVTDVSEWTEVADNELNEQKEGDEIDEADEPNKSDKSNEADELDEADEQKGNNELDIDTLIETTPNTQDTAMLTSLIGFWHSAPDFIEGFGEFYRFFDYGEGFKREDADGTFYYGGWDLIGDNTLELVFYEWNGEETIKEPKQTNIEYLVSDKNETVITIDGRKFWKLDEPVDVINGIPLYIDYQTDVEGRYQDAEVIYVSNPNGTGDNVILSYDGDLYEFKIIVYSYIYDDDTMYYYFDQDGIKYELEHLAPGFIINYENADIGSMYMEGFTFCDASGSYYAYAILHGGRGVGSNIAKISLQNYE